MTPEQIKQVIQGGQWVSIATELRPSTNKTANGEIPPFYCSRIFTYAPGDGFACTVMNYADANGKVPLVKIVIKGHNVWQGAHPIAEGAYLRPSGYMWYVVLRPGRWLKHRLFQTTNTDRGGIGEQ